MSFNNYLEKNNFQIERENLKLISLNFRVPAFQRHIPDPKPKHFPLGTLQTLTRRLIAPCSSNAYLLVNQPGLRLSDLDDLNLREKRDIFTNFRGYLDHASTKLTIPNIEDDGLLDFKSLEKYIIRNCQAEFVLVEEDPDHLQDYLDTRKRVIRVNLPELPENEYLRKEILKENDELLRDVIRKIPTPYHSIYYTSLSPSTEFEDIKWNISPSDSEIPNHIFSDITGTKASRLEIEKNKHESNEEQKPYFPPRRTHLLKHEESPTLFDRKLIMENGNVIVGIFTMGIIVISYHITKKLNIITSTVKKDILTQDNDDKEVEDTENNNDTEKEEYKDR